MKGTTEVTNKSTPKVEEGNNISRVKLCSLSSNRFYNSDYLLTLGGLLLQQVHSTKSILCIDALRCVFLQLTSTLPFVTRHRRSDDSLLHFANLDDLRPCSSGISIVAITRPVYLWENLSLALVKRNIQLSAC